MSDPSIQTFCCQRSLKRDPSIYTMAEFNSTPYNVVCLISSIIGMSGAIYQLLPRTDSSLSRRWFSLTSSRGRSIILWLAFADLLASLGVFVRSIVKLNYSTVMEMEGIAFCIILAAWIEFFFSVTWMWTLLYAVDTYRAFCRKPGHPVLYHMLAWSLPSVLTAVGLTVLYYPNADCHNLGPDDSAFLTLLPNYFVTYTPIATIMIVNPILYLLCTRKVHTLVANCLSQFTKKERSVVDGVKIKFLLIILSFYVCWLPNLINGVIIWSSWDELPRNFMLTIWYTMAVVNPLQAFFNSMVYRGASLKIIVPFRGTSPNEQTPLVPSNTL